MKIKLNKILELIKSSTRTSRGLFIVAIFLIIIGILNEIFPYIGMENIVRFISYIYFLFAVVTFLCYLYSRKDKDYEFIFLAVTSVIIGAFFYLVDDVNTGVLLGTGVLSFGIQAICIKVYKIVNFYKNRNYLWLSNLTFTILLTLTTALISFNLFTTITEVHTMLFGFYFIVYGILYLLDLILGIYVKTENFKKFMHSN